MINVFKRLAPAYGRILREFALDVWYNRADPRDFFSKAERYRRRYANELMAHYKRIGYPFNPLDIRDLSDEWLKDQMLTANKVYAVSSEKKDRLLSEMDKLISDKRVEIADLISGAVKTEGRVASVISFSNNFGARAEQIGEQEAFDLATDINHYVVEGMGDVYRWTSQEDDRVRKTHRILNGKLFSFSDPPTTVDEYGHRHTGNAGTDWGCRCWAEAASGKPLRHYIADARRR